MDATDILLEDHRQIRRLHGVIKSCHDILIEGGDVPLQDMRIMVRLIGGFIDAIHYSREEDAYFPCVASHDTLNEQIRSLMIEHELSRRIAAGLAAGLDTWGSNREPATRYLRAYDIYLEDHVHKEEKFLEAARRILDESGESHIPDRFAMNAASKLDGFLQDIDYLEKRPWCNV